MVSFLVLGIGGWRFLNALGTTNNRLLARGRRDPIIESENFNDVDVSEGVAEKPDAKG